MENARLQEMLEAMPQIAEAVNAFSSESIQQQVFRALFAALTSASGPELDLLKSPGGNEEPSSPAEAEVGAAKQAIKGPKQENGKSTKSKKSKSPGAPSLVKDLNLRPAGKQAFVDFAAEKAPSTNEERYLVSIYYMQHILELENLNRNHVFTAFKQAGWKAPLDIDSGMRKTGSRRGWIATDDPASLRVTIAGENYLEHDMPQEKTA